MDRILSSVVSSILLSSVILRALAAGTRGRCSGCRWGKLLALRYDAKDIGFILAKTLIYTGDYFQGAPSVCIEFLCGSRVVVAVQPTTLDSTNAMFDWYMPTVGQEYVH